VAVVVGQEEKEEEEEEEEEEESPAGVFSRVAAASVGSGRR